jgi:hypothetical protein
VLRAMNEWSASRGSHAAPNAPRVCGSQADCLLRLNELHNQVGKDSGDNPCLQLDLQPEVYSRNRFGFERSSFEVKKHGPEACLSI